MYVFPKDYRSKLAAKSFRLKIEPLLEKGKVWAFCLGINIIPEGSGWLHFDWNDLWLFKSQMAAEYIVRVSFGTALIASIVIVYTTIIAIASSSR